MLELFEDWVGAAADWIWGLPLLLLVSGSGTYFLLEQLRLKLGPDAVDVDRDDIVVHEGEHVDRETAFGAGDVVVKATGPWRVASRLPATGR